jgi:putative peptide zinc metalloprotease protein
VLYLTTQGKLEQLYVRHGDRVTKGQRIAKLRNPDLQADIDAFEHARDEALAQYQLALHRSPNNVEPIQQQLDAIESRLKDSREQLTRLDVVADQDGEWVAPELHEMLGSWLQRGYSLGEVVDRSRFRFLAVIQQEHADYLFKQSYPNTELRLAGQPGLNLHIPQLNITPYQSQRLPSAALGWMGGGDIAVSANDSAGEKSKESFYILRADIPGAELSQSTVLHGLSGTLRIKLAPQPLAVQIYRSIKQVVQKRYAL